MKTISDTERELRAEVERLRARLAAVNHCDDCVGCPTHDGLFLEPHLAVPPAGYAKCPRPGCPRWMGPGRVWKNQPDKGCCWTCCDPVFTAADVLEPDWTPPDVEPPSILDAMAVVYPAPPPTTKLTADTPAPAPLPGLLDPILAKLEAHAVLLAADQRTAQATNERLDELIHDGQEANAELRRIADDDRRGLGKACERTAHRIDALEARVAALEPSPAPAWEPRVALATSAPALHVGDPPGPWSSASTTASPLAFQVGTRSETPAEPTLRELQAADRAQPSPDVCSWCEGNGGTPACGSCGKVTVAS